MDKYFILMGDIKDSRKINSQQLWEDINSIIDSAKNLYAENMLSSLEIKIGDEFQAVLNDIDSLLSLLLYLDISFRHKNIECRFSMGYGSAFGNFSKDTAYNILGAGLTNTNELLNRKKSKYSFFVQQDVYQTILLNTICILLEDCLSSITEKQKIFLYYKIVKKYTDREIEEKMKIKSRAFYDLSRRSKMNLINEIIVQISDIFKLDESSLIKKYNNRYGIDILGGKD